MKNKTELKIAKNNIRNLKRTYLPELTQANISGMVIEHKLTCERFLTFLEMEHAMMLSLDFEKIEIDMPYWMKRLENQIQDLFDTIKYYEEKKMKTEEPLKNSLQNLQEELKEKKDEVCNMRNNTENKMRKAIIEYFKFENEAFLKHIGKRLIKRK